MDQRAPDFFSFPEYSATPKRLAVILAGGEGSRLRSLTRTITGDDRPKQFCPIIGDRTLLDATRERIRTRIRAENTYFSLTARHERFFKAPLWNTRPQQLIIQPENKGTAPAILYSLMRLAAVYPNAAIAFFPSDHYFSDDEAFMNRVDAAFQAIELDSASIVLLGIEADRPETSYGWIEPAPSLFGGEPYSVSRVGRFWEKPSGTVAKRLMAAGSLWNSFVMVGHVGSFLDLFREHLPDMFRMFDASRKMLGTPQEAALVRSIYSWLRDANFSADVLEKATERLLVMRVGKVGWSDWGEPHRVLGTLSQLGIKPEWAVSALSA